MLALGDFWRETSRQRGEEESAGLGGLGELNNLGSISLQGTVSRSLLSRFLLTQSSSRVISRTGGKITRSIFAKLSRSRELLETLIVEPADELTKIGGHTIIVVEVERYDAALNLRSLVAQVAHILSD